ncbi:hypothetical protein [Corallincola spongiicola]|uniref:Uncharacterized protein n=1 Tax=Corallincola spongiicola TaxID=2520508 RepID=A0ABY1WVE3_9GAMM|nr:hypothetical protein [Corallincola spongiicola]TAA48556.1 hypothetical protein EXY25_04865 [Corallincola spongiicola]
MEFNKYFKLIGLVALVLSGLQGCQPSLSNSEKVTHLSDKYSIEIKAGNPALFYTQGYSPKDALLTDIELTRTSLSQASEVIEGMSQALGIYPDKFVNKYIDAIFIAGDIKIEGAEAGGTYGPKWIILSNTPEWNGTGANHENARYAVHHELSSFVLARHPESRIIWHSMMPESWASATSDYKALTTSSSQPVNYQQGFLSKYAESSVGNDFNVYAEHAFGDPNNLKALASEHAIIAQKLAILISVYINEEPQLKSYFKETGLTAVAQPVNQLEVSFDINVDNIKPTKVEQ